jgi:hypothetical protein
MSTSSARQIVLAARPKETATFERWNIVNRVAADEKLASEATAFAERLARGATVAFAASKKIVRAYLEGGSAVLTLWSTTSLLRCSTTPICVMRFRPCWNTGHVDFTTKWRSVAARNDRATKPRHSLRRGKSRT